MKKCWKVELSAGYCGTDATEYIKCEEEDLEQNFCTMVSEHADSYSYVAQLRSIDEIMEEEGCSEEEAQEIEDQEYESFIEGAGSNSGYEECSEEEWAENEGEEW